MKTATKFQASFDLLLYIIIDFTEVVNFMIGMIRCYDIHYIKVNCLVWFCKATKKGFALCYDQNLYLKLNNFLRCKQIINYEFQIGLGVHLV
jgi:hypothetical protein